MTPPKLFLSYSHKDGRWLDELKTNLAPLSRNARLDAWEDSKISVGVKWGAAIETALNEADIAVLLVSPDFLASNYINDKELPELLKKKHIVWIAVRSSLYDETDIGQYQCANDPDRPLAMMSDGERDGAWVAICKKILKEAAANPT